MMQCWRRELMAVSERIAVLCYERARLQSEEIFSVVDAERTHHLLADIECQRGALLLERRRLLQMGKFSV